jgi:hypothetical protein
MEITRSVRVLSTLGGLGLMSVVGYVNIQHTADPDMKLVVGALAAGTALAAWVLSSMWAGGRRLLAGLALVGVLLGETFALVTTAERLLAGRDARLSQTATRNQAWVQNREALDYAISAAKTECAGGRGPRCAAAEQTVDLKRAILAGTQVPVDTNRLAGLMGWSPQVADILPTLAGSIALNLLGFAMLATGHGRPRTIEVLPPERHEPDDTDEIMRQLRRLVASNGTLSNDDVAERLGVSKGQASKLVTRAVAAGVLKRERSGREVQITLH